MKELEKEKAIMILNNIMELELSGVVRYTHYSLMVYGYNRIPIVDWLKENAQEGLEHAGKAGEMVTMLGGHPSLKIGALLETEKHDIGDCQFVVPDVSGVGIFGIIEFLSVSAIVAFEIKKQNHSTQSRQQR